LAMRTWARMRATGRRQVLAHRLRMDPELPRDGTDARALVMQGVDGLVAGFPTCHALLAIQLLLGWGRSQGWRPLGLIRRDGASPCLVVRSLLRAETHLVQHVVVANQQPFQHITKVSQQVPAVGDLDRIPGTLPRTIGIGAAAIATDDLNTGMRLKPCGERRSLRIRQQIDGQ
jgi:hypothetical protein